MTLGDVLTDFFTTVGDETMFLIIAFFVLHAIITSIFHVFLTPYRRQ